PLPCNSSLDPPARGLSYKALERPGPFTGVRALVAVLVPELALGDLLQGHRQVVLRARLDERRRGLVERALAEHVVLVVDLPRALGGDDHERVARVHVLEQLVDAGMDHG